MTNECIHLGHVIAEGAHGPVHECSQFGTCTLQDHGLKKAGKPLAICHGCKKFELPQAEVVPAPVVIHPKTRLAFVTGTNLPQHHRIMEKMIWSARAVGVREDFHAFAKERTGGAIHHDWNFEFDQFMFKVEAIKQCAKLDYDMFCWIDCDNYFVRHADVSRLIRDEPMWCSMEGDLAATGINKRPDWWSIPADKIVGVFRGFGITTPNVWNTNAGMFIVRKSAVDEFSRRMYEARDKLWALGYKTAPDGKVGVTEEPPLAIVGQQMVKRPLLNTFWAHSDVWVSDWLALSTANGHRLPDGSPFKYFDWISDREMGFVSPAIVHAMRGKNAMNVPLTQRIAPVTTGDELVGDEVKAIFYSLGFDANRCDTCRAMVARMNQWGIAGCLENKEAIYTQFRTKLSLQRWHQLVMPGLRGMLQKITGQLPIDVADLSDPAPKVLQIAINRVASRKAKNFVSEHAPA